MAGQLLNWRQDLSKASLSLLLILYSIQKYICSLCMSKCAHSNASIPTLKQALAYYAQNVFYYAFEQCSKSYLLCSMLCHYHCNYVTVYIATVLLFLMTALAQLGSSLLCFISCYAACSALIFYTLYACSVIIYAHEKIFTSFCIKLA